MKKKLISPFLLLLLLSLTVIALSSCGCKHEQTAWKYDLEATCESEGLRHMVCGDCGKTLEEGEYTVGHRYESEICVFCGEPRYGEELLEFEPVTVNGKIARASYDVKPGDILEITLGARSVKVKVTEVKETVRKEDAATMYTAV